MGDDARVYAGVDAHKDKHVLCVLDWMGRKVLTEEFSADAGGYERLAAAIGDPSGCAVVGVEGTSSYGADLSRRLSTHPQQTGKGRHVREKYRARPLPRRTTRWAHGSGPPYA